MPSRRQERINGLLVSELSRLLRTLKDPRLAGMVTVLGADISPDLRQARVRVSVLGEEEDKDRTLTALASSAGHLRRELAHCFTMKRVPELEFVLDYSLARADEINRLIAAARASDPNPGPAPELAPAAPDEPDAEAESAAELAAPALGASPFAEDEMYEDDFDEDEEDFEEWEEDDEVHFADENDAGFEDSAGKETE